MMTKKNNKTIQQLERELLAMKTTTMALLAVLTLLLLITIYGLIFIENKSTFIALLVVVFSCSTMVFLLISNMKKIKAELNEKKGGNKF